jgi:PAS domain-containing protein
MLGRTDSGRRLLVVLIVFVVGAGALVTRLGYWQVGQRDQLVASARRQIFSQNTVPSRRGQIFDRSGTVVFGTPLSPGNQVVRFRSGAGPERISEIRSVAVRGDDGANAYVITYFREVTEQVVEADQVEALYLHAEQTTALLDALYQSAPVGLGFWDRELRYVRVNEALARINERSVEDHVGRTFHEVVPQLADDLEAIAAGVLER